MLGIIVCDDDRFMLDTSVKMVKKYIAENRIPVNVVCATTDYNEALCFVEKNIGSYLYFLDIDFGASKLNGIDIARHIKKREPLSKIVFVTSHIDMGMSVLKSGVEAFGFIEKTEDENKLFVSYKKYIGLARETTSADSQETNIGGCVKVLVGIDEYVSLLFSQILYVEADKSASHFVCYHTVDGSSVSVRDTIENVLRTLGADFMKSHRSVVINKSYVVGISNGMVVFAGGETTACSFRLRNDIKKKCGVR